MGPRSSIVAGLLVGVATAAALLAGVVALAPEPATPTPSVPLPSIDVSSPSPAVTASPSAAASPSPEPSAGGSSPFHVGEPAPPLVVPQVGGGSIDLAALRGKPVWVNFMATWCPPCQDEFPLMNGFATRYADDGLVVVAIDVKEEEGVVASFAQSLGATFPLGLDSDGRAAETWDAIALPVHFWIDADGIVRDGSLGGIGPDVMARGLRTILPGVDVKP
ncbi:MAG: TlpA disulfide reductase family protein [Candidatus Limnocylindrales bacterium]|nr:TlpA disulfide reductase family protein [Candidatus Limnocylindrales bacterium]